MAVHNPSWKGTIFGKKADHGKVYGHSALSCAKTIDRIAVLFKDSINF